MNNPVLDVAIGLIFIYLLYSLLATTIKELVATIFSYRGRMLERGIEQMLDGENYSYYWWDKLFHIIAVIPYRNMPEYKNLTYHQRAVKNCGTSTKAFINNSKLCKKKSLFTANVTNHPLYLRAAENSVLFKKPAYLTSDTFSDILIDLLSSTGNKPVLLKDIANNIRNNTTKGSGHLNGQTKDILNLYIAQANGDLVRFKLLIEKWYDDTMDRVGGWYKRQSFRILLIIGLLLAAVFNVSTVVIVQKLSADKPLRDAMVNNASAYIKANQNKFNTTPAPKPITEKSDSAGGHKPTGNATAPSANPDTEFEKTKDGLKKIGDIYKNDIEQQNATLGLGWGDYGYKADSINWAADSVSAVYGDTVLAHNLKKLKRKMGIWYCFTGVAKRREEAAAFIKGDTLLAKNKKALADIIGHKPVPPAPLDKIWYVFLHIWVPKNLIGFLITALAISMGAPFWFDLLNKFINLRASGAKPDDKASGGSKTATLNQKPQPNSFA